MSCTEIRVTRRGAAAAAAGHEVRHFRKRVEPRLLDELAPAKISISVPGAVRDAALRSGSEIMKLAA